MEMIGPHPWTVWGKGPYRDQCAALGWPEGMCGGEMASDCICCCGAKGHHWCYCHRSTVEYRLLPGSILLRAHVVCVVHLQRLPSGSLRGRLELWYVSSGWPADAIIVSLHSFLESQADGWASTALVSGSMRQSISLLWTASVCCSTVYLWLGWKSSHGLRLAFGTVLGDPSPRWTSLLSVL